MLAGWLSCLPLSFANVAQKRAVGLVWMSRASGDRDRGLNWGAVMLVGCRLALAAHCLVCATRLATLCLATPCCRRREHSCASASCTRCSSQRCGQGVAWALGDSEGSLQGLALGSKPCPVVAHKLVMVGGGRTNEQQPCCWCDLLLPATLTPCMPCNSLELA